MSLLFRTVRNILLFGAGSTGAQKVYFEDLNKDIFLEVQMKPVVKYGVY